MTWPPRLWWIFINVCLCGSGKKLAHVTPISKSTESKWNRCGGCMRRGAHRTVSNVAVKFPCLGSEDCNKNQVKQKIKCNTCSFCSRTRELNIMLTFQTQIVTYWALTQPIVSDCLVLGICFSFVTGFIQFFFLCLALCRSGAAHTDVNKALLWRLRGHQLMQWLCGQRDYCVTFKNPYKVTQWSAAHTL